MVSMITELPIPKLALRKLKYIGQTVLDREKIADSELSVLLTNDTRITELNQRYFQRNCATDVIAFPQSEAASKPVSAVLGDVVISIDTAERQAIERNHHLEDELGYLLIHGILHLLGYDDIKSVSRRKMRAKERVYVTEFHLDAHPETMK
ncbi:MAG: rRNA maturation RNase YbeY [bacterium]